MAETHRAVMVVSEDGLEMIEVGSLVEVSAGPYVGFVGQVVRIDRDRYTGVIACSVKVESNPPVYADTISLAANHLRLIPTVTVGLCANEERALSETECDAAMSWEPEL